MNALPNTPLLVLIVGLPGSGKTTLSKRLAKDLGISLIGKDEIKELLFDTLGWNDRDWSARLGGVSFELLYLVIEKMLATGRPVIVDADFSNPARSTPRLTEIVAKHSCRVLQVSLSCTGSVVIDRFHRRSHDGTRHPGHVDHLNLEVFRASLAQGRRKPLELEGTLIEVDTTDFDSVRYEALLGKVRDGMA